MPCSSMIRRNIMPPRASAPRNPAVFARENTRILKRLSRNIGSSTRLSMNGNATRRTMPMNNAMR